VAGAAGEPTLKGYLDSLATAPMVSGFAMGPTQRDERSGGAVQSFEVSLTLVDLPPAVAIGGEDQP
jgi:hypothetical protein